GPWTAALAVARERVRHAGAGDGRRAADRVAARADPNLHDVGSVAECYGARHVGADVVAGHDFGGRARPGDRYARHAVAADDVALRHIVDAVAVGADTVAAGARDQDTIARVGQGRRAGGVGADKVALDGRAALG